MFGKEHCEPLEGNLEGKVLVLRPDRLKPEFRRKEFQAWRATGGFGCSPTAMGSAVFATCLMDEDYARWERGDFLGILKDEYVKEIESILTAG